MAHMYHESMFPLRFCYQVYSLLVIGCFCTGITLLGMAFVALYGMGGKELCLTISFITFYSLLRLCIPPWEETLKSLFSGRNKEKIQICWAVDHMILGEDETDSKLEPGRSPCCPICLYDFVRGNKLAVGRHCRHVFHQECLELWLPQNTSCPYCRRDLQERHPIGEDDLQKPASRWHSVDWWWLRNPFSSSR